VPDREKLVTQKGKSGRPGRAARQKEPNTSTQRAKVGARPATIKDPLSMLKQHLPHPAYLADQQVLPECLKTGFLSSFFKQAHRMA
jgi:hypothetical protein